jgi:hypothetical protein
MRFVCIFKNDLHKEESPWARIDSAEIIVVMRRPIWKFAALSSLVLCMLTMAVWARSYFIADMLFCYGDKHSSWRRVYSASLERGQLRVGWGTETGRPPRMRSLRHVSHRARFLYDDWVWERLPRVCKWLGFGWSSGDSTGCEIDRTWYVQVRSLALLLMVPLIVLLIFAGRAAPQAGFCPHCGYDLRGTPNRCPECGLIRDGIS